MNDRRHTRHHLVEERYGDINHHVVQRAARGEQRFERWDAPERDRGGQEQERGPRANNLADAVICARKRLVDLRRAHIAEAESTHRLPAFQE
ncbi:hypothetical protein D3C76_1325100 [compost metagenome]